MRALKDASPEKALADLGHAIALDPYFALARLGRVQAQTLSEQDAKELQDDIRAARSGRDSLGERDRALLYALEPWATVPPDLREVRVRLEELSKARPGDAGILLQLAAAWNTLDDSDRTIATCQAALAADPSYAAASQLLGRAREGNDDVAGAFQAEQACLAISPASDGCLWVIADMERGLGRCNDLLATSARLDELQPRSARVSQLRAGALAGAEQPLEAVRAALEQRWALLGDGGTGEGARLEDEAALAVLAGDLLRADAIYAALERQSASSPLEYEHFRASYPRALLALEEGRAADAVHIADDYLRRRAAWTTQPLATQLTIALEAVDLAAGGMTRARFDALRDEWLEADRRRKAAEGTVAGGDWTWSYAFASAALTESDARAALAARDGGRPFVIASASHPMEDEWIGRTYSLAGRPADAAAFLDRASASCAAVDPLDAVPAVRASLELGTALEAAGDGRRACDAYARVLRHWGKATAPSRTAREARERARRLACPE
jgi:hypothetical protein